MNREEYLRLLSVSLNHIPQAEKEEAIRYYNDYFDDAGAENEQEVIKTLGSPASLAESIEKEFATSETGFRKTVYTDGTKGAMQTYPCDDPGKKQKKKMSAGMITLMVILLILASPMILALGGCAVGVVAAVLGSLLGVIVALAAVVWALICVVAACIALAGAIGLVSPFSAVTLAGIGLFILGICIFIVMAIVWVLGIAIPWVIKQIVKLCKKIFGRKGERVS